MYAHPTGACGGSAQIFGPPAGSDRFAHKLDAPILDASILDGIGGGLTGGGGSA
jgi:hypothetical protein